MNTIHNYDLDVSREVASFLVNSLSSGVGDDMKEDIQSAHLSTHNSSPARIWDHINTNIENNAHKVGCVVTITNRGPWDMCILYDPNSNKIITIMREQRFSEIRKRNKKRATMHYLEAFSKNLNSDLLPRQGSFFDTNDDEGVLSEAKKIVDKMLLSFDVDSNRFGNHVLVLFTSNGYQLSSVRAVMLDSHLDEVCSENWSSFITARESVVAETVEKADAAYNNPARGLKLTAKATERQERKSKIKEQVEEENA